MDPSQPSSLSPVSYKSTHSSRSSVLERAREYNRRIEDQKHGLLGIQHSSGHYTNHYSNNINSNDRRRSKSLERGSLDPFGTNANGGSVASGGVNSISNDTNRSLSSQQHPQRSQSAGRAPQYYYHDMNEGPNATTNYSPTRNRAMASVNHNSKKLQPPSAASSSTSSYQNNNHNNYKSFGAATSQQQQQQPSAHPPVVSSTTKTPIKSNHTNNNRESTHQQQQYNSHSNTSNNNNSTLTPTTATTATQSSGQHPHGHHHNSRTTEHSSSNARILVDEKKEESHIRAPGQPQQQPPPPNGGPVVTPELLVDALSGHEDGLLAIAEKLMEHYDSGYDVMGEAIIDAFADVQKLFQHGTIYFSFIFETMLFPYSHHLIAIGKFPSFLPSDSG